jgi:hypothetical protein
VIGFVVELYFPKYGKYGYLLGLIALRLVGNEGLAHDLQECLWNIIVQNKINIIIWETDITNAHK